MGILRMVLAFLRAFFANRAALAVKNVMLRQQLIVVHRSTPRPKFHRIDRVLLCWLSRLWSGWRSALLVIGGKTGPPREDNRRVIWTHPSSVTGRVKTN